MRFLLFIISALVFADHRQLLARMDLTPKEAVEEFLNSSLTAMVPDFEVSKQVNPQSKVAEDITLPLVFMHGMGDSCFNRGMKNIAKNSGKHVGVYSVCIPTGDTRVQDTLNGFLMTMDDNVDEWAKRIQADPQLANGFHAIGFSQGNSVIRGYIHKYNNPPVNTFISVHGTINGVGGFPNCNPVSNKLCQLMAEVCGDLAYFTWAQNLLFQADYFRDPHKYNDSQYIANSQIAQWNQENPENQNILYKANFMSLKRMAMVKALQDSMVFPNEGEWWGQFAAGGYSSTEIMNQTANYQKDSFGLKTMDQADKLSFTTTTGDHLQFSQTQLYGWLDEYLTEQ